MVDKLRYAAMAAVLAVIAGAVTYLSESPLMSFFALLAMQAALLLAVAFIILSLDNSHGDSSGAQH